MRWPWCQLLKVCGSCVLKCSKFHESVFGSLPERTIHRYIQRLQLGSCICWQVGKNYLVAVFRSQFPPEFFCTMEVSVIHITVIGLDGYGRLSACLIIISSKNVRVVSAFAQWLEVCTKHASIVLHSSVQLPNCDIGLPYSSKRLSISLLVEFCFSLCLFENDLCSDHGNHL